MSDAQNNQVWQPLEPTKPNHDPEVQFLGWLGWEDRFGEYGEPGFSRFTRPTVASEFFGHSNPVDLEFTLYRGEDGLLLGIHAIYIDDDGIQRNFIMTVHPDHRRKGIATKMAQHIERLFVAEKGPMFGFTHEEFAAMSDAERAAIVLPKIFSPDKINTTPSLAGFANNFAESLLDGTFPLIREQNNGSEGGVTQ